MANNQIVLCTSCRNYVSNIINIPPSPTPHLHRTQLAPDISESILIGESVSHARTTVSQLDAEIEKMSATLNELRNKRDGLHRFVLEHESFLAPIRRLPVEILTHIFFLCLQTLDELSFDDMQAPLLLTRVCAEWRDSAWSSQRLWASFTVSSTAPFNDRLAQSWLSYANSSPLSVCIKFDGEGRHVRGMWSGAARAIHYCDRWKELSLDAPASVLRRFGSIHHRLPCLESLSISLYSGQHTDPIRVLEFAPRLRRVELKSLILPSMLKLPWPQLTHLETRSDHLDTLLSILNLSYNLTHLKLFSSAPNIFPYPRTTVILPALLTLNVRTPYNTTSLFARLLCPALQTLHMKTTCASWESNEFILFLRSCTTLNTLNILHTERGHMPVNFVPCLHAVPSVTALRLHIDPMTSWLMEEVLTQLTFQDTATGCLLPALTDLEASKVVIKCPLFAEMVQSRLAPATSAVAQFQKLCLSLHRDPTPSDGPSIQNDLFATYLQQAPPFM